MFCAHAPVSYTHLIFQTVVAGELFAYRLAQLDRAAGRSIARHALIERALGRVSYVLGRIEIRLARAKSYNVYATLAHRLFARVYRQRRGGRYVPAAI